MAGELGSRRAEVAAMGLVGILGCIGAAVQDTVSGVLIEATKTVVDGKDVYPVESFDTVFPIWIGTSILALLLVCTVWKAKKRE